MKCEATPSESLDSLEGRITNFRNHWKEKHKRVLSPSRTKIQQANSKLFSGRHCYLTTTLKTLVEMKGEISQNPEILRERKVENEGYIQFPKPQWLNFHGQNFKSISKSVWFYRSMKQNHLQIIHSKMEKTHCVSTVMVLKTKSRAQEPQGRSEDKL